MADSDASNLVLICRDIFQIYGTLEQLRSDDGPSFMSIPFSQFLDDWAIKQTLSSTAYPQSNSWAELAVKAAKRIVNDNTGAQGTLDDDCAARTILQYRNNTGLKKLIPLKRPLLTHNGRQRGDVE